MHFFTYSLSITLNIFKQQYKIAIFKATFLNQACSKDHKLLILLKSNWPVALSTRATLLKNKNFFFTFPDAKISKSACPL
jgi:hypothetical protein